MKDLILNKSKVGILIPQENDSKFTTGSMRCGSIVPLSMTQRELKYDAHAKIDLFEKLIGQTSRGEPT
jgi:hypothetical protein